MKIKNNSMLYLLYIILIITPIYRDSILTRYMGGAGETFLPLIVFAIFGIAMLIGGKFEVNWMTRDLIKLGFWLLFVSYAAIFFWAIVGKSLVLYGEFLPLKVIKVAITYFSYPIYITILLILMKKFDFDSVMKPFMYILFLLAIICFIEKMNLPYAFTGIHSSGVFPYYRIRLLTREASETSLIILNYMGLSFYYTIVTKKKIPFILTTLCSFYLLAMTESKSLMMSIGIMIIIYFLISMKKMKKSMLVALPVVIFAFAVFYFKIYPKLKYALLNDMANYTSMSTRLYTMILGLLIGCVIPTGVGAGVYLGVFSSAIKQNLGTFSHIFPWFASREVMRYVNQSSDDGLTVKSGILQYNMYWGIIGTIILAILFFKLYKNLNNSKLKYKNILVVVLLTNLILMLVSTDFSYEFWMYIAIILYFTEGKLEEKISN